MEVVEALREKLGLDKPIYIQYLQWMGRVLRGDLGNSYVSKLPVSYLIKLHLPATIELSIGAMLFALFIALPTGIMAAVKQRSVANYLITGFNSLSMAVPNFWLGIMLILLLSLTIGWLPPSSRPFAFFKNPSVAIKFLIMPVVTLGLFHSGLMARFVRSAMLEVLNEDYIRTARSKGYSRSEEHTSELQ